MLGSVSVAPAGDQHEDHAATAVQSVGNDDFVPFDLVVAFLGVEVGLGSWRWDDSVVDRSDVPGLH